MTTIQEVSREDWLLYDPKASIHLHGTIICDKLTRQSSTPQADTAGITKVKLEIRKKCQLWLMHLGVTRFR